MDCGMQDCTGTRLLTAGNPDSQRKKVRKLYEIYTKVITITRSRPAAVSVSDHRGPGFEWMLVLVLGVKTGRKSVHRLSDTPKKNRECVM